MLGGLLEKSGVPYTIFERVAKASPVGMTQSARKLSALLPSSPPQSKTNTTPFLFSLRTGAGMLIGPALLPTFQQLGIYEEFLAIGKKLYCTNNYKESLEKYRPTDTTSIEDL
jgi:hypothetical protein